jgi:hypothetical protein
MQAQLPERAGCPQCGSIDGRRWRSFSGVELCTDCEWDYLSSLNERKLLSARSELREPRLCQSQGPRARAGSEIRATSLTPSRPGANPGTTQRAVDWHRRGSRNSPRSTHDIAPGTNSICLLCSHIFYGAVLASCPRCGGLCRVHSDHSLELMARRTQAYVEPER